MEFGSRNQRSWSRLLWTAGLAASCGMSPPVRPAGEIVYVGSSTVAVFLRDAEPVYGAIDFRIDTLPESAGGERAILAGRAGVRPIAVDGEAPSVTNFAYPMSRPLYLLWRPGNAVLDAFIAWSQSEEGQRVVMKHFVGRRVLGSLRGEAPVAGGKGLLVVHTDTFPYYDGGIVYYPHRPYEILTREGESVRRVPNHRGENDEVPMRVELAPGTYLVRAETSHGSPAQFLVTIRVGELLELDVGSLFPDRQ
jgi:hypothetical protein